MNAVEVVAIEKTCFWIGLVAGCVATVLTCLEMILPKTTAKLPLEVATFLDVLRPFSFCVSLGAVAGAVNFLKTGTVNTPFFTVMRSIQSFGGNVIRNQMLILCLDRILSTFYRDVYHNFASRKLGIMLATIPLGYSAIVSSTPYFFGLEFYNILAYHALGINFLIIFFLFYLTKRNQFLYKMLSDDYNLVNRFQIFENIKTINSIRIQVWLMSVITILGPISNRIVLLITGRLQASVACFYLFYNIYLIITGFRSLLLNLENLLNKRVASVVAHSNAVHQQRRTVITAFGTKLPGQSTIEEHFHELQKQWEKAPKS